MLCPLEIAIILIAVSAFLMRTTRRSGAWRKQIDAVGHDAVGAQIPQALGCPFVIDGVAQILQSGVFGLRHADLIKI